MADGTGNVIAWSAAVSGTSAAFASIIASRATTPLSHNPWFVLSLGIAVISFLVLLLVALRSAWLWWRARRVGRQAPAHAVSDEASVVAPGYHDPRLPALRDLITECKMLRSQLPDPRTWTLADPIPEILYRGLGALDERAAAALEPGWMEQFRNDPPDLWRYAVPGGANGVFAAKIDSRLDVLETIIRDLQERPGV